MNSDDIKLEDIYDVAVLRHGFTNYVRDYEIEIEANWIGELAGRYVLTFKHCYDLTYETLVNDDLIRESWDDIFTNYELWKKCNEPSGFVWGTNWSLAYPGFSSIKDSARAKKWSNRLKKTMIEVLLETNSFRINLIFESSTLRKISDENTLMSQVMIPLKE